MNWRKVGRGAAAIAAVAAVGLGALVTYLLLTADSRLAFPDTPYPTLVASTDPAVIEQGRYLVMGPAHCSQCHSTGSREHPELNGTLPLSGGFEFAMAPMGASYSANLTPDPETGIGRRTDAEIARTVRTGVTPDGQLSMFMRYSAASPSDEDLVAIMSYLRSVPPVHNDVPKSEWYTLGKLMMPLMPPMGPRATPAPTHVPASEEPTVARGEYLANYVAACVPCHSHWDMSTYEVDGPKGGGGQPDPSHGEDHDMEFVTPNLTSHPTGITGKISEDAFVARIRAGRVYASSIMPWENFQRMTDPDLRAVYRYLHSLPPVDNDVGPTYRPIGWTASAE